MEEVLITTKVLRELIAEEKDKAGKTRENLREV
jgi:hypothetical protein